jgi:hypothetical protein
MYTDARIEEEKRDKLTEGVDQALKRHINSIWQPTDIYDELPVVWSNHGLAEWLCPS